MSLETYEAIIDMARAPERRRISYLMETLNLGDLLEQGLAEMGEWMWRICRPAMIRAFWIAPSTLFVEEPTSSMMR